MKTKKQSKFTLEKFEVAKLKNPSMRRIIGGLGEFGGNDPIGGQDNTNAQTKQGGGGRG